MLKQLIIAKTVSCEDVILVVQFVCQVEKKVQNSQHYFFLTKMEFEPLY